MGLFDRWAKKKSAPPPVVDARVHNQSAQDLAVEFSLGSPRVPLVTRLASSSRDRFGLLPHEALLLHYAPKVIVGGSPSAGFWEYRYDIAAPGTILKDLMSRGYLEPGDAHAAVEKKTMPELKQILASKGESTTGKKADLVARVIEAVAPQELANLFPERHYSLTDTGRAAVDGTPHIIFAHNHQEIDGLDIFRIAELHAARPETPWRDLVWTHLDQRGLDFAKSRDFGLYANTRRVMATMHAEEGRYTDAIATTAEVIHWDLSGTGNGFSPSRLAMHAEILSPHIALDAQGRSIVSIPPGLVTNVFKWAGLAGTSDDELWALLNEQFKRYDARLRVFTSDELAGIVFMQRDGDTTKMRDLYKQAAARFKMTYGV